MRHGSLAGFLPPGRPLQDPRAGIEWPIVGREAEQQTFARLLTSVDPVGIVLSGPPGVGKTRLARDWLGVAERAGLSTAWVTADRSARTLPLFALARLLPAAETIGGGSNRIELLQKLAAHLLGQAGHRRLVLFVDDAHLLDDLSAALIHQLARSRAALIVVTVRLDEPRPDPITALWKDGLSLRAELEGLPVPAVAQLLSTVLGPPVDPGAIDKLAERSEGNPLFLRELTIGAIADGTLLNEGGGWQLVGDLAPSDRLVELVESRLQDLDRRARDFLELVSYAEVLEGPDLAAFGGDELATLLERKGFLTSRTVGDRLEVRIAHPLYGDVIRARTPAVRIRHLARLLADTIEGSGATGPEDSLRVARWRLDGGGAASPSLMLTAATTARWRYDFPLAERLAVAAAAAGAGFEASLLAARLASLQGRTDESERQLALLGGQATTDTERAVAAIARAENLVNLGRGTEALHILELAELTIVDPGWLGQIAARRTAVVVSVQGLGAVASAAAAIEGGKDGAQGWASMFASHVWSRLGRFDSALACAVKGRSTHRTSELDWYPWFFAFVLCGAFARVGRFSDSDALANTHYRQSLVDGSSEERAYFAWHLARGVMDRGDVDVAVDRSREAARLFRRLGRPAYERTALIALAGALAAGGRAVDATDVLDRIDAMPVEPAVWSAMEVLEARAWTAVARGDLRQGRRLLSEAADVGEEIGDLVGAAAALHGLGRLGLARQHHDRLAKLSEGMDGHLVRARVRHMTALRDADAVELEAVSHDFEEMGAGLLAAEAAADAYRGWKRSNDNRSLGARRRADELRARIPGAWTPALLLDVGQTTLTETETETAVLAASGLSNRIIAEKLSLSVRTVENRLQRCYEKLAISSRRELHTIFDR